MYGDQALERLYGFVTFTHAHEAYYFAIFRPCKACMRAPRVVYFGVCVSAYMCPCASESVYICVYLH
jgi:hypothetical protein